MISAEIAPTATLHYFDREFAMPAVKLLPGEYYVASGDMLLTTVLGSCVSACVRDIGTGVGGMNHFMLPEDADPASRNTTAAMRYGAYAMAMLINELFRAGAKRERLEAKVFGGGAVLGSMTKLNIGERNADFVLQYLDTEGVRIVGQDLRGSFPRRINYFPLTGRVAVRKLRRQEDTLLVQHDEQALVAALSTQPTANKARPSHACIPDPEVNKKVWAV